MSAKELKGNAIPSLIDYKEFLGDVRRKRGNEVEALCRFEIEKGLRMGRRLAGPSVLHMVLKRQRAQVNSRPGSVKFIY